MAEAIKLTICIFLPPVIGVILVFLFRYLIRSSKTPINDIRRANLPAKLRHMFGLHPEEGLVSQAPLWLVLTIPLLYFLTLGLFAWSGHSLNISAEGLRQFISISALPLACLSIAIPLAGLVSRLHSTQQTALQIKTTKTKNNIDLYNLHRKSLFDYFDMIEELTYEETLTAGFKIHPKVHKLAFTGVECEGTPTIEKSYFDRVDKSLRMSRDFILAIQNPTNEFNTQLQNYIYACITIRDTAHTLGIQDFENITKKQALQLNHKTDTKLRAINTIGNSTAKLISSYRYCFDFYHNLCRFANHDSPYILETLSTSDDDVYDIHRGRGHFEKLDFAVEGIMHELKNNKTDYLFIKLDESFG